MKIVKKYIKRANHNWKWGPSDWVVVAKLEDNEYITWTHRTYSQARLIYMSINAYSYDGHVALETLKIGGLI